MVPTSRDGFLSLMNAGSRRAPESGCRRNTSGLGAGGVRPRTAGSPARRLKGSGVAPRPRDARAAHVDFNAVEGRGCRRSARRRDAARGLPSTPCQVRQQRPTARLVYAVANEGTRGRQYHDELARGRASGGASFRGARTFAAPGRPVGRNKLWFLTAPRVMRRNSTGSGCVDPDARRSRYHEE